MHATQRGPTRPGPAFTCYGILSVGAQALEAITRQRSCRFQHTITRAQFVRVKLHAAHTGSTAAGQGSQHPHANRRRRGLITGMLCGGHEVAATVERYSECCNARPRWTRQGGEEEAGGS